MFARIGRTATLALGFIALGMLFIFLGWFGAAALDYTQGQIPYLISGGVAGLSFVLLGAGLLIFESGRRGVARLEAKMDELIAVQSSGSPRASAAAGAPAVAAANGLVVVGRSSFHRKDCRLVAKKEDNSYASTDEAVAQGLEACRVCDPLGAQAGSDR